LLNSRLTAYLPVDYRVCALRSYAGESDAILPNFVRNAPYNTAD
jgi:hypothetical protein